METIATKTFLEVMEGKAQPSLKAIADVFGVPQQRLYSVAKQPIAGEVYDARVYNWGAISKFIEKRIGKEGDKFATMEEVYEAAVARDEELSLTDKRRGSHGTSKSLIDLGDGKTMPARKKAINVGDKVVLKGIEEELEVVYLTSTHAVLKFGETLNCLSNWTFNQKVVEVK